MKSMNDMTLSELNELRAKISTAEHELQSKAREVEPKPRYVYHTVVMKNGGSWDPIFDVTECIRLVGELVNGDEKDEHMARFGSINGYWNETLQSVVYFRVNGQIVYMHSGHLMIKTPQQCTDQQWEVLKETADPKAAGLKAYNE